MFEVFAIGTKYIIPITFINFHLIFYVTPYSILNASKYFEQYSYIFSCILRLYKVIKTNIWLILYESVWVAVNVQIAF